ncbi:MAG TPA: hypothetical protein PKD55_18880, partial [Bellilinea sp.]|nr:hypothetical protein [Bellilinea sp.]
VGNQALARVCGVSQGRLSTRTLLRHYESTGVDAPTIKLNVLMVQICMMFSESEVRRRSGAARIGLAKASASVFTGVFSLDQPHRVHPAQIPRDAYQVALAVDRREPAQQEL